MKINTMETLGKRVEQTCGWKYSFHLIRSERIKTEEEPVASGAQSSQFSTLLRGEAPGPSEINTQT